MALGLLTIINSWEASKKIELGHSIKDLSVDLCWDIWNDSDLCVVMRNTAFSTRQGTEVLIKGTYIVMTHLKE